MGSVATFPRVETIVVPDMIMPEFIGKYVTDQATKILTDLGIGGIIPRTAAIRALTDRLFLLSFETGNGYTLPKTLEIRHPHARQSGDVAEISDMALRIKGGSKPTSRGGVTA